MSSGDGSRVGARDDAGGHAFVNLLGSDPDSFGCRGVQSRDVVKFLAEVVALGRDFQGLMSVLNRSLGCLKQHALLLVQCVEVGGDKLVVGFVVVGRQGLKQVFVFFVLQQVPTLQWP